MSNRFWGTVCYLVGTVIATYGIVADRPEPFGNKVLVLFLGSLVFLSNGWLMLMLASAHFSRADKSKDSKFTYLRDL
jgi:hypothetical protein